jgi:hypothetical protein
MRILVQYAKRLLPLDAPWIASVVGEMYLIHCDKRRIPGIPLMAVGVLPVRKVSDHQFDCNDLLLWMLYP